MQVLSSFFTLLPCKYRFINTDIVKL